VWLNGHSISNTLSYYSWCSFRKLLLLVVQILTILEAAPCPAWFMCVHCTTATAISAGMSAPQHINSKLFVLSCQSSSLAVPFMRSVEKSVKCRTWYQGLRKPAIKPADKKWTTASILTMAVQWNPCTRKWNRQDTGEFPRSKKGGKSSTFYVNQSCGELQMTCMIQNFAFHNSLQEKISSVPKTLGVSFLFLVLDSRSLHVRYCPLLHSSYVQIPDPYTTQHHPSGSKVYYENSRLPRLCIWISMTPVKDPKGLSQGKPWRGRFSDLVIYDVLYHISTFVHKCVLDLPITSGKFRRSLYCSIMIVDLLQANEDIQTWIMLCAAKLVMLVWKLTSTFSHETLPSPVTIFSTMTAHAGN
jgi:hypothetical protein